MRRVFAWFRSHPLTTIFLVLIGFAVGAHLFANWRAEVRWQRYCAAARARGVKLTLAEFAPPEIPDAENFAALPMFRAAGSSLRSSMDLPKNSLSFGDARTGERTDWQAWQKLFKDSGWLTETTEEPARDVLRGLEHYAPQFKEWSEWKTRPHCRFSYDYSSGVGPRLPMSMFIHAAKLFDLRLRAHLAVHESAAALADFQDGLQAYRALQDEPMLLSAMLRICVLSLTLPGVADGLKDRAWSDDELRQIESELAKVRVWQDYRMAFSSERGFANWYGDLLADPASRGRVIALMGGPGSAPSATPLTYVPRRVYRDNQLRQNQNFDELIARVSEDGSRFDPDGPNPSSPVNLRGPFDYYYFFMFRISTRISQSSRNEFVFAQTILDQARLAIALERWRLARGAYPETLAELVPDFIAAVPVDTYSRKSMLYRRQDGGTFLLYGVGQNRTDDGGVLDPNKGADGRDDIWPYAPPPSK